MKRGPKRKSVPKKVHKRITRAETARLFHYTRVGFLFRNFRPWCQGEEVVIVVYLGVIQIMTTNRKRVQYLDLLLELFATYFPDAQFTRSLWECEVKLTREQRKPRVLKEMRKIGAFVQTLPVFDTLKKLLMPLPKSQRNLLSAGVVCSACKTLIISAMELIFGGQPGSRALTRDTVLLTSNVTDAEAAAQLAIGNLCMVRLVKNRLCNHLHAQWALISQRVVLVQFYNAFAWMSYFCHADIRGILYGQFSDFPEILRAVSTSVTQDRVECGRWL